MKLNVSRVMKIKGAARGRTAGVVLLLVVVAVAIGFSQMIKSFGAESVFTQTEVPATVLALHHIDENVVKVSVAMNLWDNLVLVDLRLSYAELAYYRDSARILVEVRYNKALDRLIIRLHGRKVFDETGHPLCIGEEKV